MNVDITLPDGSVRNFESPVTGYQIAESIGPRLLKDAICVEIDNKFQDLSFEISENMKVRIVTTCLLYTSPSPRDATLSRMPSSA